MINIFKEYYYTAYYLFYIIIRNCLYLHFSRLWVPMQIFLLKMVNIWTLRIYVLLINIYWKVSTLLTIVQEKMVFSNDLGLYSLLYTHTYTHIYKWALQVFDGDPMRVVQQVSPPIIICNMYIVLLYILYTIIYICVCSIYTYEYRSALQVITHNNDVIFFLYAFVHNIYFKGTHIEV